MEFIVNAFTTGLTIGALASVTWFGLYALYSIFDGEPLAIGTFAFCVCALSIFIGGAFACLAAGVYLATELQLPPIVGVITGGFFIYIFCRQLDFVSEYWQRIKNPRSNNGDVS